MRYFVRFTYNGTPFHGSQTQPNGITVQETLEQAFSTILRQPIALTFAGRTDAGVHALEMYAHFDLATHQGLTPECAQGDSTWGLTLCVGKLNRYLPDSIVIYEITRVSDEMHARFSAQARTYYYKVTEVKDPFNLHLLTQVAPGLDYDLMNQAAQLLIGTHDFASFCKVHTDVNNTICTISEAQWYPQSSFQTPPTSERSLLPTTYYLLPTTYVLKITANRFLRNMVRAIVGTLFEVGRHKMSLAEFQLVIDAKNRCSAGQSAPPDGLYLAHISYPDLPTHRFIN